MLKTSFSILKMSRQTLNILSIQSFSSIFTGIIACPVWNTDTQWENPNYEKKCASILEKLRNAALYLQMLNERFLNSLQPEHRLRIHPLNK